MNREACFVRFWMSLSAALVAGLCGAAEVKLSETEALQGTDVVVYTFAAGDTFVVDAAFSPTSFKPTCPGDFTMKVVEGGSVASSTTLDFSDVTGALTLSSLGTADARLPAPTVASNKTINIESCWFSALTLTSSAGLTGVTYNVTGTGALGTLNGYQYSSNYKATLNLSGTQEITTVNSPYKSGEILWTVNVASGAQVTVTGTYDVGCTKLNLYGSLTCQGLFRTGWKDYQASDVYVYEGGSLICKENFNFGNGFPQVPSLSIQGGTVEVAGTFTRNNSSKVVDRGQVGMSAGLLKVGALMDNNAGNSTNTNTLHFGCERNNKTNCLLTGGTLEVTGGTWTSKGPRFHTKGTAIKIGADTTVAVEWVVEAETPLSVAAGKTLTLNNALNDGASFNLADNKGTVALGTRRPTLTALGGTVAVTPTDDEKAVGVVQLPVTAAVTDLSGATFSVEGWTSTAATLADGTIQLSPSVEGMPMATVTKDTTWTEARSEIAADATEILLQVPAEAANTVTVTDANTATFPETLVLDVAEGKTLKLYFSGNKYSNTMETVKSIRKLGAGKAYIYSYNKNGVKLASDATFVVEAGEVLWAYPWNDPPTIPSVSLWKEGKLSFESYDGRTVTVNQLFGDGTLNMTPNLYDKTDIYYVSLGDVSGFGGTISFPQTSGVGGRGAIVTLTQSASFDSLTLQTVDENGDVVERVNSSNPNGLRLAAGVSVTMPGSALEAFTGRIAGGVGASLTLTGEMSRRPLGQFAADAKDATTYAAGNLSLRLADGARFYAPATVEVGDFGVVAPGSAQLVVPETAAADHTVVTLMGEGAAATSSHVTGLTVGTLVDDVWTPSETWTLAGEGAQVVLSAPPEALTMQVVEDCTWSGAEWKSGDRFYGARFSGNVTVAASVDATVTLDCAVALDALTFDLDAERVLTFAAGEGSLTTTATEVTSGKVIAQAGSYGTVTLADDATLLFAQDGMFSTINPGGTIGLTTEGTLTLGYGSSAAQTNSSRLVLRKGTFRKEGSGSVTLQVYNVADAEGQSIEVAGGTLTFFEQGGYRDKVSSKSDRHIFKSVSVDKGTTLVASSKWAIHFAVSETLRGEGTIRTAKGTAKDTQPGLRQFVIDGEAVDFTGALNCAASSLVFGSASSGSFGGSATLEKNGEDVKLTIQRAGGVTVAGDVTLGDGVGLDLSAGGALIVGGTFTLGGTGDCTVTLPVDVPAGFAVVTLADGTADKAVAARMKPSVEGLKVAAVGSQYLLVPTAPVTLPAVKEDGETAGSAYGAVAEAVLQSVAYNAGLDTVRSVTLQTRGGEPVEPTITAVNHVLACFDGVVTADSEAKTLRIAYEFGLAKMRVTEVLADGSLAWEVTAKVAGASAEGVYFAEGATVAAYEVAEESIPADAVPLATYTIAAGERVSEVVLSGTGFGALGTHPIKVRVQVRK